MLLFFIGVANSASDDGTETAVVSAFTLEKLPVTITATRNQL